MWFSLIANNELVKKKTVNQDLNYVQYESNLDVDELQYSVLGKVV